MSRKYSLLLVNPKRKYRYHWDLKEICAVMGKKVAVHALALPTLAAITPEHYSIRIIDEEIERIPADLKPDLVGITALISNVKRGYQIADLFRSQGVKVVMGGPQVSFNIEETLQHADSVVIGEAEGAWEKCLSDFEKGDLKTTYRNSDPVPFSRMVPPRWDLVKAKEGIAFGVQVSRGCPYRCDFCLVRNMFGPRQRYRDIDNVIEEIRNIPGPQIAFADDNLTADKKYARELMLRLIPLKISWTCQASIDVAFDKELLELMADAGCSSVLIGFESVDKRNIDEMGKAQNQIERYETAIKNIHEVGIHVIGSFIAGFDNDTTETLDRIHEFTLANNLSYVMLNLLCAYPGTDLYARMKEQQRLCSVDPDLINGVFPTLRFKAVGLREMYSAFYSTIEKIYSISEVRKKARELFDTGNFRKFQANEVSNVKKVFSVFFLMYEFSFLSGLEGFKLLRDLSKIGLKKNANMGAIVQFLLFIASFRGYLRYIKKHRRKILRVISEMDR